MDNIVSLFEDSNFGTVLLDEVGDLSLKTQSYLVSAIDNFSKNSPRIISTSQHNLIELMEKGAFRKDLYFRLNGISIYVSPLRKRLDDIDVLVEFFLSLDTLATNEKFSISEEALEKLKEYTWPGNIRQLRNLIKVLKLTCDMNAISVRDVSWVLREQTGFGFGGISADKEKLYQTIHTHLERYFDLHGSILPPNGLYGRIIKEVERPLIELSLEATRGNQAKCAKLLGINRNTLRKKISEQKLNLTKEKKLVR
jgi:two-component system nitrogen regulation response regulator GlnG